MKIALFLFVAFFSTACLAKEFELSCVTKQDGNFISKKSGRLDERTMELGLTMTLGFPGEDIYFELEAVSVANGDKIEARIMTLIPGFYVIPGILNTFAMGGGKTHYASASFVGSKDGTPVNLMMECRFK